ERELSLPKLSPSFGRTRTPSGADLRPLAVGGPDTSDEDTNITSNLEFLRAKEDEGAARKKDRRSSGGSKHVKRSSLPSISLSNTKNLLAGKFGDAFRRFEANTGAQPSQEPLVNAEYNEKPALSPITGSETTGGRSDDEHD